MKLVMSFQAEAFFTAVFQHVDEAKSAVDLLYLPRAYNLIYVHVVQRKTLKKHRRLTRYIS